LLGPPNYCHDFRLRLGLLSELVPVMDGVKQIWRPVNEITSRHIYAVIELLAALCRY
jgi:hypothetical protein